ncbi:MAG: XTP/dITP diphosphatase [Myxococcales bacterium]|nr:XTP/dITP diphosphatase [Myxococcales bacterium]
MKILIATSNRGKLRELRQILEPLGIETIGLGDLPPIESPEETGATFSANARLKALYYAQHAGIPAIADDSGLCVDALNGEPGVRSARYSDPGATDRRNNAKLLAALTEQAERRARFVCVSVCAKPTGEIVEARGECEGEILAAPRGENGFGYDPVFYYAPLAATFAELPPEEKNRVSHRGRSLRRLAELLPSFLAGGK